MFKPTSDNYEALTRANDYILQIMEDIRNSPDSTQDDIEISDQLKEMSDGLYQILSIYDECSE